MIICYFYKLVSFEEKDIVIARLLSSSRKNFNVAHYSKSIKGINTKLWILPHHEKMQLQGKGHSLGVIPIINLNF